MFERLLAHRRRMLVLCSLAVVATMASAVLSMSRSASPALAADPPWEIECYVTEQLEPFEAAGVDGECLDPPVAGIYPVPEDDCHLYGAVVTWTSCDPDGTPPDGMLEIFLDPGDDEFDWERHVHRVEVSDGSYDSGCRLVGRPQAARFTAADGSIAQLRVEPYCCECQKIPTPWPDPCFPVPCPPDMVGFDGGNGSSAGQGGYAQSPSVAPLMTYMAMQTGNPAPTTEVQADFNGYRILRLTYAPDARIAVFETPENGAKAIGGHDAAGVGTFLVVDETSGAVVPMGVDSSGCSDYQWHCEEWAGELAMWLVIIETAWDVGGCAFHAGAYGLCEVLNALIDVLNWIWPGFIDHRFDCEDQLQCNALAALENCSEYHIFCVSVLNFPEGCIPCNWKP